MNTFYTWCWYYHLSSRQENLKNANFGDFHLIPSDRSSRAVHAPASRAQSSALSLRDSYSHSTCCAWPLRMPSGEQRLVRSFAQLLRSCTPPQDCRAVRFAHQPGQSAADCPRGGWERSAPAPGTSLRSASGCPLRVPLRSRSPKTSLTLGLWDDLVLYGLCVCPHLQGAASQRFCNLRSPERIAGQFAALTNPVNSFWQHGAATAMRRSVTRNFATLSLRATAAHPRSAWNRPILRYAQQWGRFGATGAPY